MARIAGKLANFSFDGPAMEDELNSIEMSVDINLPDVTCFGDLAETFVEGIPTSSFAVSGFWDPAAGGADITIMTQIGSGAAAIVFQPTGESAGADDPNYTGVGITKSYRIRAEVGGPVTYDASFQVSGALSRGVGA